MRFRLAALTLLAIVSIHAQPAFEVATIKPTPSDWTGGRYIRMQTANQLQALNYTLKVLIAAAWNVSPQAVSGGPAWLDTDHYDIIAKVSGARRPTRDEQMAMLRTLIADRFHLTFHREPKQMPVLILTVARSGSKLQSSAVVPDATPEGPPPPVFALAPDVVRMSARYVAIADFVGAMQRAAVDRPVLDQTGLSGRYDFDLAFVPDESLFGGAFKLPENPTQPGFFAAIEQQLGLKLEASRGPVETIVVDRLERPTEN